MSESVTSSRRRAACAVVALCLLGACAQKGTTVILLPSQDGAKAAVVAKQGETEVVLDRPYAAVKPSAQGLEPYVSNPQEVQAKFGPALAAMPGRPASFTLYFVEGKDEFTPESKLIVDNVFSEIAKRPVPDVVVIGHTDTVGTDRTNDALGLQRAEAVRAELIRRGVAPGNITAISRGKRELMVPTADGVAEPRNRRVEILVR
jgi:outer membrane protein OmpA-like peptidoglycan-associated protein